MAEALAFRAYYQRHAGRVQARVARYRANDPDGRKRLARFKASLAYQYRTKPSLKLAIAIYALGHQGQKQPRFWRTFMKAILDYATGATALV